MHGSESTDDVAASASIVAKTLQGLKRPEISTDEENQLAVDLVLNMSAHIGGPKSPKRREQARLTLFEAFRYGKLDLVAMGETIMVVDSTGGRIFAWTP